MDGGDLYAPLLVLVGPKDDWRSAAPYESMAERSRVHTLPVVLKVYPSAYHAFDDPSVGEKWYFDEAPNLLKMPMRGATLGYDPDVYEDALVTVHAFLTEHLR